MTFLFNARLFLLWMILTCGFYPQAKALQFEVWGINNELYYQRTLTVTPPLDVYSLTKELLEQAQIPYIFRNEYFYEIFGLRTRALRPHPNTIQVFGWCLKFNGILTTRPLHD
jgi:hypothetical protein